tara:strand:- start:1909 stop:2268 length:360 start_codon:yes stop_codon:yes gene_type:complete
MAAGTIKIDIAGLRGQEASQPRVFAHDGNSISAFPAPSPDGFATVFPEPPNDTEVVYNRGACLYVGGAGDIDIELESGARLLFKGVTAGSFLPVLATKVYKYDSGSSVTTTATDIIALF